LATILGIESTCDETAAAVVVGGREVRSNVVATQAAIHAKYRGVVPEIASRAHLENICLVIQEALSTANLGLGDIDAVAVAYRPGLIGSLLIGVTAAKTLAWSLGKPLIGVDHVHAHLYSVMLDDAREAGAFSPSPCTQGEGRGEGSSTNQAASAANTTPTLTLPLRTARLSSPEPGRGDQSVSFPAMGLVCSGGHTALYRLDSWLDVILVGSTLDDAVGEAYDKVAAILGLGYPGGPIIDGLARTGNADAVTFPRALLARDSLDFSFSGLKTSVLYHVRGKAGRERGAESLDDQQKRDVAAAFQRACVEVLIEKIRRAAQRYSARSVIIGGGVSANRGLREGMADFPLPVFFPAPPYCTDNAAMIAGLGDLLLQNGKTSPLDLDAVTYSQFVA
jgi:N6-L-threonylcarbamoyladenine synthase